MKKLYSSFFLMLLSVFAFSQITYVNGSATGLNDGSSWTNAFVDLHDALDKFNGQSIFSQEAIWVAAGTYKPGGSTPDTSSNFFIDAEVDLYGGFSGSESELSERDLEQNETILSGDFDDNDGVTIDSVLRIENARHVVLINSTLDRVLTIDGFTVQGGNTSYDGDVDFINRAGGGILSFSPVNIFNCIFKNNFGRSGAGVAIDGGGSANADESIVIKNCTFSSNEASNQSAGAVFYEMGNVEVSNCTFSDNQTNRGCLYPNNCTNFSVKNCTFENNNNDNFGGGMFVWQTINFSIDSCQFKNNTARSAAGFYYDARNILEMNPSFSVKNTQFINNTTSAGVGGGFQVFQATNVEIENCRFNGNETERGGGIYWSTDESPNNPEHIKITNCEFSSNSATERGGGMYGFGTSYTMESCTVLGNSAVDSGGGIYNTGDNKNCIIRDCVIANNLSQFGGGIVNYGDTTMVRIENSDFLLNEAETSGASLLVGFKAETILDNSEMKDGTARFGGAVSIQNDSSRLYVLNSNLESNTATGNGGAINCVSGFSNLEIENSTFTNNTADFGGALNITGVDSVAVVPDTSFFNLRNSIFENNTAASQAGAINILNKDGRIENCIIHGNVANGPGTGGAISHNTTNMSNVKLDLVNSTIVNNLGLLASGIAGFTDGTGIGTIRSINTIYKNLSDFRIEDGAPVFESLGGNITRDAFMTNYFISSDIIGEDPLFVDEFNFDFRLTPDSPCRDAGVAGGSLTDILGFDRDANPDIGAYEWSLMSGLDDSDYSNNISVYPNPTSSILNIELNEGITKTSSAFVYNSFGERIKKVNIKDEQVDISFLENGIYHLVIDLNDKKLVTSFIKVN